MLRALLLFVALCVSVAFWSLTGCSRYGSGADPALIAQHRTRLTLSEEPEDVLTVVDVREELLGENVEEHVHSEHEHEADADHVHVSDEVHDHDGEEADHDHDEDVADDEEEVHEHNHDEAVHDEHDHDVAGSDVPSGPIQVAMVGQVGGLTNPWSETQPDFPFATNQAALFLADPQAVVENEESGHSHAPGEECAFCAAHAADNTSLLAMVRFVNEKGEVLRMDVRDLFDVEVKDTVVVLGKARVVEGGMLMVDATGLYIRR